jgi:hypothetical protein
MKSGARKIVRGAAYPAEGAYLGNGAGESERV